MRRRVIYQAAQVNNCAHLKRWMLHCQIDDSSLRWQLFENGLSRDPRSWITEDYITSWQMGQESGLTIICFGLSAHCCDCERMRWHAVERLSWFVCTSSLHTCAKGFRDNRERMHGILLSVTFGFLGQSYCKCVQKRVESTAKWRVSYLGHAVEHWIWFIGAILSANLCRRQLRQSKKDAWHTCGRLVSVCLDFMTQFYGKLVQKASETAKKGCMAYLWQAV